jgi:hypothetical protein
LKALSPTAMTRVGRRAKLNAVEDLLAAGERLLPTSFESTWDFSKSM